MAAQTVTCPALSDYLVGEQCTEQFAGLGSVMYVGLKTDLAKALTLTETTYDTPTFKDGKGLYKIELKEEANSIEGVNLGHRKGFKQTFNFVIEAADKKLSELMRALNNNDVFIIVPDTDDSQIMYDPVRKISFGNDGIKLDTGKAATDERQTTLTATLGPVKFPYMYVTAPVSNGWDSLLASAKVVSHGA